MHLVTEGHRLVQILQYNVSEKNLALIKSSEGMSSWRDKFNLPKTRRSQFFLSQSPHHQPQPQIAQALLTVGWTAACQEKYELMAMFDSPRCMPSTAAVLMTGLHPHVRRVTSHRGVSPLTYKVTYRVFTILVTQSASNWAHYVKIICDTLRIETATEQLHWLPGLGHIGLQSPLALSQKSAQGGGRC